MTTVDKVANSCKNTKLSIDKLCNIKKYLTVKEKISFVKYYSEKLNEYLKEYAEYEVYIGYVVFGLTIVKYYTDIEIEMTFDEYDKLQENGIIDKIIEKIGSEYSVLLNIINCK